MPKLPEVNKDNIKEFWEARGYKYKDVPFESLSNFEEDPNVLTRRIEAETNLIFSKLSLNDEHVLLDLGSGVGQWSFRFSSKVKKVVAVEYALSQIEIAKLECANRNIANIDFVHASAEEYIADVKFDVIFISGLIVYLNDEQTDQLIMNVRQMVKPEGIVFLREPSSVISERYQVIDQYSKALGVNYSAIYRTPFEYIEVFNNHDFKLMEDGQIFPESSSLNKFPETRLRYYIFDINKELSNA